MSETDRAQSIKRHAECNNEPSKKRRTQPLPDNALLYYLARSAHEAAHNHLQQAFIPTTIRIPQHDCLRGSTGLPYVHDTHASSKALALLSLAADLLRLGLKRSDLSDQERAYFACELSSVLFKIVSSGVKEFDVMGTLLEISDLVRRGLIATGTVPSLARIRTMLELYEVRVLLMQARGHEARRQVKRALAECSDLPHRYAMQLLLLEYSHLFGATECLAMMGGVLTEARSRQHTTLHSLLLLSRTRMLFHLRRWDLIPEALAELEKHLTPTTTDDGWRMYMTIHFVLLSTLWHGRIGDIAAVKELRKRSFALMDEAADTNIFVGQRTSGGVMTIHIGQHTMHVQGTPPNVLYLMTYLVPLVSHREFTGPAARCKPLSFSEAMRSGEDEACMEGLWDVGFSSCHDPGVASRLQQQVTTLRAEVLMERAMALLYRNDFEGLEKVLSEVAVPHTIKEIAPQLLLLHAQYAQAVGRGQAAVRYYRACMSAIQPGSEMGLVAEIGLLACKGELGRGETTVLIERCRSASSTLLNAALFLSCLLESGIEVKRKLASAWTASGKNHDHVLRCLIFAFFAAADVSGQDERQIRQLRGGQEMARSFGGLDRSDRVGQTALGLWFALQLERKFRGRDDQAYALAQQNVDRHLSRRADIIAHGMKRFS